MADIVDVGLLTAILVVTIILLVILIRRRPSKTELDPASLTAMLSASLSQSSGVIKGALAQSLMEMKIGEGIGAIKTSAESMTGVAQQLQALFLRKGERAQWAEMQLAEILADVFPADKLGLQEELPGIGRPDACLHLTDGVLCIDAKFPLENYRNWASASDQREKKRCASLFAADVKRHVDKVAGDYVRRDAGTLPVAFVYLPSEAIYGYLLEHEQDLLRRAAAQGVVICSPSTILASLNLVWTAERAIQITQRAELIEQNLRRLSTSFDAFEGEWETLRKHIQNSYAKMQETQTKYGDLKARFESTSKLEGEGAQVANPGPARESEPRESRRSEPDPLK